MRTNLQLTEPDLRRRMADAVYRCWIRQAPLRRANGQKHDPWIRGFAMGYWTAMMEIQRRRQQQRRVVNVRAHQGSIDGA